ncbi:hypothetical protein [Wenzhouxiangella marina]|uniref:Uncharacterized protein n=1 Tax=Wenzhouxiangella marina TaxID=1579979 RepID=A0A0K0XZ61_9GAMM|nr:hypothetical protein [Wenzhouxiangella marina]AKS42978.1 hypothetical protein WM2015_2620 [Wenzhouxiangella marina]MBB6087338.1 hypothetical protein [Wenzhouxiangella marina]
MKIVLPLLIMAIWATLSIEIEDVWSPIPSQETLDRALATLEQPGRQWLASLQGKAADPAAMPLELPYRIHEATPQRVEIRIAFPSLPSFRVQPSCG